MDTPNVKINEQTTELNKKLKELLEPLMKTHSVLILIREDNTNKLYIGGTYCKACALEDFLQYMIVNQVQRVSDEHRIMPEAKGTH